MRSLVELERLLAVMRDDRHTPLLRLPDGSKVSVRACWWHLNERYLRCVSSTRELTWRGGRWQGLTHGVVVAQPGGWQLALASERSKKRRSASTSARVRVVTWDPGVRDETVARGVLWLAENWLLEVEPMLPRELMVA
jgi:hypothetical protein